MIQEGVTQYQLDWHYDEINNASFISAINEWRTRFFDMGLIGQDPLRYDGIGFGNISCRLNKAEFLISGTQTGADRILAPEQYCKIISCDIERNYVKAAGPIPPSSESMTHHMIYQIVAAANVVFHLHAPAIWSFASYLKLPITPPEVGYGTPAMAQAVRKLITETDTCVIAMGGHQDGIIGWANEADAIGNSLISLHMKAMKLMVP